MLIVAIGWLFVVAAVRRWCSGSSPQGSVLVALLLVFGAGVAPLAVVLYVMGAPARRRAPASGPKRRSAPDPDAGGHAAGDAVAPEREEP